MIRRYLENTVILNKNGNGTLRVIGEQGVAINSLKSFAAMDVAEVQEFIGRALRTVREHTGRPGIEFEQSTLAYIEHVFELDLPAGGEPAREDTQDRSPSSAAKPGRGGDAQGRSTARVRNVVAPMTLDANWPTPNDPLRVTARLAEKAARDDRDPLDEGIAPATVAEYPPAGISQQGVLVEAPIESVAVSPWKGLAPTSIS